MDIEKLTNEQKKELANSAIAIFKKMIQTIADFVNKVRHYVFVAWRIEKVCQFSSSTVVYSNSGVFDASICTKAGDIITTAISLIPKELSHVRWQYEVFIKLLVLLRFRVLTRNDVHSVFQLDKFEPNQSLSDLLSAIIMANDVLVFANDDVTPGMDERKATAHGRDALNGYREALVITQLAIAHHMLKSAEGDVRQHITAEAYKIYTVTESFWWPLVTRELIDEKKEMEPYFVWPIWLTDEERANALSTSGMVSPLIRSLGFFIETHIDPYYKSSE